MARALHAQLFWHKSCFGRSIAKMLARPRSRMYAEITILNKLVAYSGASFEVSLRCAHCRSRIRIAQMVRKAFFEKYLYHARTLRDQRTECYNVGSKLFINSGQISRHNSNFFSSFWLGLFVVRAFCHM